MSEDITQSGHFYTQNQVFWSKYLTCPKCGHGYYHAFGGSESLLDWDAEIEALKEEACQPKTGD